MIAFLRRLLGRHSYQPENDQTVQWLRAKREEANRATDRIKGLSLDQALDLLAGEAHPPRGVSPAEPAIYPRRQPGPRRKRA